MGLDPSSDSLELLYKGDNFLKYALLLVRYCGFKGLILGKIALSSVPWSLGYSRMNDFNFRVFVGCIMHFILTAAKSVRIMLEVGQ